MTDVAAFIRDRLREQMDLIRAATTEFTKNDSLDELGQPWAWGRRSDGAISVRYNDDPRGELDQTPVTRLIDSYSPYQALKVASALHQFAEIADEQRLMSIAVIWAKHPDSPFDTDVHHHEPHQHEPNQKRMDGSD